MLNKIYQQAKEDIMDIHNLNKQKGGFKNNVRK